jgi:hypothetical protein
MGLSFRKSFGTGPFRINLSRRGISYSVGVKGARVNFSPSGTYVNLSSHGISYRRKISGGNSDRVPAIQPTYPVVSTDVHNIASANVEQLTDTDFKDFIAELTKKAALVSYTNWYGVIPLIIFLLGLAYTSLGTRTVLIQPATDSTQVKVTNFDGVYIRAGAGAHFRILKSALYGQTFSLLDSTDAKWLKVRQNDTNGFISRRYSEIIKKHDDAVTSEKLVLANIYSPYLLIAGLVGFTLLIRWLKRVDKNRFQMELHYQMDEQFKQVYEQFSAHFTSFSNSARIWQYLNARQSYDYKRTGGAGKLIKRAAVMGVSTNQPPLPHFITNVSVPCLQLSNLSLYFLPERLLIKRGRTFAAVFYKNLNIDGSTTRFIEDESVPRDAQIIDQTWRYVNKSGGPDRRFNNNRQIPICAYSEYTIKSDTGIYEILTTSKKGAMDAFAGYLMAIGKLQKQMEMV